MMLITSYANRKNCNILFVICYYHSNDRKMWKLCQNFFLYNNIRMCRSSFYCVNLHEQSLLYGMNMRRRKYFYGNVLTIPYLLHLLFFNNNIFPHLCRTVCRIQIKKLFILVCRMSNSSNSMKKDDDYDYFENNNIAGIDNFIMSIVQQCDGNELNSHVIFFFSFIYPSC